MSRAERESFWQQAWQRAECFTLKPHATQDTAYVLEMFPYPSGEMHMGHVRNYTIGDVFARFLRARGKQVLHPMGWDALGLPAENQAIRENISPKLRTPRNIAQMRHGMQAMGFSYDWTREFATSDPGYYRFNQWFFCQMYRRGWVYRRRAEVHFCPQCNTVLANEQVSDEGHCWRGHPGVGMRMVDEWAFKITAFADALLEGLDQLKAWPERIVEQQRHWIGKSSGALVRFAPVDAEQQQGIEVFTTRLDTIYGCSAVLLSPEHPQALQWCQPAHRAAATTFCAAYRQQDEQARRRNAQNPQAMPTGIWLRNPLNEQLVPLYLCNYVLGNYGSGAVMCVPAHDSRDYALANQLNLPICVVCQSTTGSNDAPLPDTRLGVLVHSGPYSGLRSEEAMVRMLQDHPKHVREKVYYHLRDWGFSRQRYWGTPIPIVYCDHCGEVLVPEAQLPIEIPDFRSDIVQGGDGPPLSKVAEFVHCACPQCGRPSRREVETMDTFVDSAWYFARFLSPQLQDKPFDPAMAKAFLPIDIYIGGPEHAVMHLLYFRFFTRVMRALGLLDIDEPVRCLITQGMVNAVAARCPQHGYVRIGGADRPPLSHCPQCQTPLLLASEKMSKSKYNGVELPQLLQQYGADAIRLFVLFAAPLHKDLEWSLAGVEGVSRFLQRLDKLVEIRLGRQPAAVATTTAASAAASRQTVLAAVHQTLSKVEAELSDRYHFNTAIAALMSLVNVLYEQGWHLPETEVETAVVHETFTLLAHMLGPMAPHCAEELWARCGHTTLLAQAPWPAVNRDYLHRNDVVVVVQVAGKRRAQLRVPQDMAEAELLAAIEAMPEMQPYLHNHTVVRRVVVPNRLVNYVTKAHS